ncbi:mitochondrial Homoaconitase [Neonectria punicea]|uniref:Mitochondrial Homoaconitase n=1 Tax=Neonectria punicea TaxID=979145 RepID=A0ABR1H600_9HYPO
MTLDHDVSNESEQNLRKYRRIEEFANKHGIDFYPAKHGIGHRIMVEEGYAWPGTVAVASDSHSNIYGGVGCFGTAIVRSDAASVLATSTIFWQVPPIAKITFTGILPPGVTGKDAIIALCFLLKSDVLNMCIEFTGSEQTLASIPISERLTIANMTTEWGALSGLFPVDDTLISWYRARATIAAMSDSPTKDRINHKRIDELVESPLVADPGSPKALCYLASPEVVAASAIKGQIASPGWYLKPEGVEKVIVGEGTGDFVVDKARSIEDGFEKIIGEMESMISAAEGAAEEAASPTATEDEALTDVLPGFPEKIEGEIVFCDNDNIHTDGIYPGRYTYQDGMTTEQMAEVCMENYDTEFRNIIRPNDVLVAGYSFGSGSFREQAATSILANKVRLVVAGSFSNIFSRNSINNALLGIELPKLIERLREVYKDDKEKPLTRRTGWKLLWDVRRSKVTITEQDGTSWVQQVGEMPPNVQEIVAKGGIVKWVQAKLQA